VLAPEDGASPLVGREAELALVHELLDGGGPAGALLLAGEAGIGKSALLDAGIADARERGVRVLAAQPAGAEVKLAFAGLGDLLDGVAGSELTPLHAPQRHALEVALLRAEPGDAAPQPHAIALGLLGALRALAAHQRLLIAIDECSGWTRSRRRRSRSLRAGSAAGRASCSRAVRAVRALRRRSSARSGACGASTSAR
jgi:hypothetical protein